MKHQVLVIHGGDSFESYAKYIAFLKSWRIDFSDKTNWKENLGTVLGEKYEIIAPKMPNKLNARYLEWKIWFEKFIPHLQKDIILVGHSLGGLFLIKYLSENKFPKKLSAAMFVSAPLGEGNFKLKKNLNKISEQCEKLFLYHSKDDKVVPFSSLGKYKKAIPSAIIRELDGRGHFNQEKFPEIVKDIKNIFKK